MRQIRITKTIASITLALLLSGCVFINTAMADSHKVHRGVPEAFHELIELSLKEKKGLTFFMNGQALPAVVTKVIDERTVEGRNQQYDRIIIRLSRVNAIAAN
jgi:hypothetical protein